MTGTTTVPDAGPIRPFGWKDKFGYAFGDLGNDFSFILSAAFLAVFYTNVLGVSPAIVGTIMMVVRVLDAFVDVTVGRLVDRSPLTPAGRFRPWIARFGIPVAVASVAMYLFPAAGLPDAGKIVYVAVTYLLWSVLYSTVNIPYGSMASVVTSDPVERSSLSVFRTFGAFVANILISFFVPLFISTKVNGKSQVIPANFLWAAVICAVLSILAYFACYNMSVERVRIQTKPAEEAAGLGKTLASLFGKNRAMVAIVVAALLLLIATLLTTSMASYLWLIYFNNMALQGVATMLALLPTLLLLPVATPLSRRFGKREVSIIGVGLAGVVLVILSFFSLSQSPAVFIGATIVAGIGLGIFNMLIWAFITDVIDYQEILVDERDDGVVYSVYSWARKVGQALAAGIGMWALSLFGYVPGLNVQQPQSAVQGIYLLSTLIPGVLYLAVTLVLLFWYPLSKKKVEENTSILNQRHSQAMVAAVVS